MTNKDVIKDEYASEILKSLRKIIRAVDLQSKQLQSKHQMTAPQLLCFTTIVEKGPLTLANIADEVGLSSSTLVGIIDRLEKKDLVVRERSRVDRRQVLISSTKNGQEYYKKAPESLQDKLLRSLNEIHEPEREQIHDSLNKVVDMLEVQSLDTPSEGDL
jgi:DNA-binding MarR family transcriptional regulator